MKLTENDIERFWQKVKIGQGHECWEWQSTITRLGYGSFSMGRRKERRTMTASRISWMINNGAIPDKLFVCHKCDNPTCVNPEHLFLGTHQDNTNDKVSKGRQSRTKGSAKINQEIANQIRNDNNSSLLQLAMKYGVGKRAILDVKKNRTWKV